MIVLCTERSLLLELICGTLSLKGLNYNLEVFSEGLIDFHGTKPLMIYAT